MGKDQLIEEAVYDLQRITDSLGHLLMASVGSLKPEKCFYLFDFFCMEGRWEMVVWRKWTQWRRGGVVQQQNLSRSHRERDRWLMEMCVPAGFSKEDLFRLNKTCLHQQALFLLCVLGSDEIRQMVVNAGLHQRKITLERFCFVKVGSLPSLPDERDSRQAWTAHTRGI